MIGVNRAVLSMLEKAKAPRQPWPQGPGLGFVDTEPRRIFPDKLARKDLVIVLFHLDCE
jgi:hypothetical protein